MFYVKMNKGKFDAREVTQSYFIQVLRQGEGVEITKAEYDYYSMLQWMREVGVKHGEGKVLCCVGAAMLCNHVFKDVEEVDIYG